MGKRSTTKRPEAEHTYEGGSVRPARDVKDGEVVDRRIALFLGLFLFFLYLVTACGRIHYGDERDYLEAAHSFLTEGNPYARFEVVAREDGTTETVRAYSLLPPGQSILMLPVVGIRTIMAKVWRSIPIGLTNVIVGVLPAAECAATCALLFLLIRLTGETSRRLRLSRRTALALSMAAALCTQLFPYSSTLFADTSTAFLLLLAVYANVRFSRRDDTSPWWLLVSACAMATACLTRNNYALAVPALGIHGGLALRRRLAGGDSQRTYAAVPGLVCGTVFAFALVAIIQLWYNNLRYGSVWNFGYQTDLRSTKWGFSNPLLMGLYGIGFSSGRSFFLYSPVCILAFAGARRFARSARLESWLIAGITVPLLISFLKWWAWYGGWEWGCRFYLFLVPLLMWLSVPAWRWLDRLHVMTEGARRMRMGLLVLLLVLSVGIQVLGKLVNSFDYWSLVIRETAIFEYPTYADKVWEIRDDTTQLHYIPHFSQPLGNAWMIWATMQKGRMSEDEIARSAPWCHLNPAWRPNRVEKYLGLDLWFYRDFKTRNYVSTFVIGVLLSGSCVACATLLWTSLRRKEQDS